MPYPTDEDFYEFRIFDNMYLAGLGPGFPLFFMLMQYLILYMLGLCLIYFVPNYLRMSETVDLLKDKYGYSVESDLAMLSYGAFVVGALENDTIKANMTKDNFFEDQQDNINALGVSFTYCILYSFVAFFYMRKRLFYMAQKLNAESLTPADYCVMVMGCDFEDNGSEE